MLTTEKKESGSNSLMKKTKSALIDIILRKDNVDKEKQKVIDDLSEKVKDLDTKVKRLDYCLDTKNKKLAEIDKAYTEKIKECNALNTTISEQRNEIVKLHKLVDENVEIIGSCKKEVCEASENLRKSQYTIDRLLIRIKFWRTLAIAISVVFIIFAFISRTL